MPNNLTMTTAGGRIRCTQCQALAKSTQQQCRRPAASGKRVCRLHGGKSTGPKTQEGRQRCAAAKTVHGNETAEKRLKRSTTIARLAVLEWAGHMLGFMQGPKTRGPKPKRMDEVEVELQMALREKFKK